MQQKYVNNNQQQLLFSFTIKLMTYTTMTNFVTIITSPNSIKLYMDLSKDIAFPTNFDHHFILHSSSDSSPPSIHQ